VAYLTVISMRLPGGTVTKTFGQESWCPSRDLNTKYTKYVAGRNVSSQMCAVLLALLALMFVFSSY
jgi:hypothetical protein